MFLEHAMLAAFLTPALAAAGVAAMGAPILIHLLARRRFRRIRWAAMDFLLQAQRCNRRRIRMEEWILPALRCLAVLLIGLLLARPFLTRAGWAGGIGGRQRTERVFVLDDTFSMAYESAGSGETLFQRAQLGLKRLIESVRSEYPDDTVTVVRLSYTGEPVAAGIFLDEAQTGDLFLRLEALTPSQQSVELTEAFEGIVEVLERGPDIGAVALYVLSDFQRHNWVMGTGQRASKENHSSESVSSSSTIALSVNSSSVSASGDVWPLGGVLAPLVEWAGDERTLSAVLVNVGDPQAQNVALTEVALEAGRLVAGTSAKMKATLVNYGEAELANLDIEVSVGGLPQPTQRIERLAPREPAVVELEADFLRTGDAEVRVSTSPDALPLDNVRYLSTEVASAVRILVVNGEPSPDTFDDEVTFLTTALRPEGDVFSGNEVVIVDEAEVEPTRFDDFHLVILANVYRLSDPTVENLERYTRGGGGVLVFLGDQVDADLYNAAMYREGDGLLPAKLNEIVGLVGPGQLRIIDALHPALTGLVREGDPLGIGRIPFFRFFSCDPFVGSAALGLDKESPTFASMPAHRPARVPASFVGDQSYPAMVERSYGLGRVLLITTGADKEWHLWPDHPSFLPAIMELVRYLARRSYNDLKYTVGSTIKLPIDLRTYESDAAVRAPVYPAEREIGINALPVEDGGQFQLAWEHSETAGFYRFLLRNREGGESVRVVAVNLDTRESDLAMVTEDELRRALKPVAFEYVMGLNELSGSTGTSRTEFWYAVLFGAAFVLMSEQFLAWHWGRRR